jgi:hypothetical protein
MQVRGDSGSGNTALIHPDIEALRAANLAQNSHSRLREYAELGCLLHSQFWIFSNMSIGTDQEVPGVVRELVEDRINVLTAGND